MGSSNHSCRTKTHRLQTNSSDQLGMGLIPSGGRAQTPVESLREDSWMGEHRDGVEIRNSPQGSPAGDWPGPYGKCDLLTNAPTATDLLNPRHLPVKWFVLAAQWTGPRTQTVRRFCFNKIETETLNRDFI